MSHGDPEKWNMPGWRIEQRYANGVLIGNWAEERQSFQKGSHSANSTHRTDFRNYSSQPNDVILRRKAQLQNEGLGKEMLFYHHGNRYSSNMISWYDEHYNKRERDDNNRLPELRSWNSHQLAWLPEKSDHPIQALERAPTNFGLRSTLQSRWNPQENPADDFESTYRGSYFNLPNDYMAKTRYANPRTTSSKLLRTNNINKDMHFRNKQCLQAPEPIPTLSAPVGPRLSRASTIVY